MATQTMRAVRFHEYGPPSVLVVDTIERPAPKAGEVLIRVRLAGVNPIDWKLRAGHIQRYMPITLPATPGLDVAGTIEAIGEDVTGFSVGDKVFGRGAATYAEFAVAPVATIARIPDGVSFEQAATLHVGGVTAWVALFDNAHLEAGQRLPVELVDRLTLQRALTHRPVDLGGAQPAGQHIARDPGQRQCLQRVVALVRDGHHLRTGAESEQQLRRVGHETHDAHPQRVRRRRRSHYPRRR